MQITIKKPIEPGKRRAFTLTPAAPLGVQDAGYVTARVLDGDSSAPTINKDSTDKKITGWLNGNGSLGEKRVRLHVDGHIGKTKDGKPGPLAAHDIDVTYTVGHTEATEITFVEGADETIPPA